VNIESVLARERSHCRITAASKKRALEEIAIKLSDSLPEVDAELLFDKLINREKLGTTAIGHGVAIPHCRLDQIKTIVGGLFTLNQAVDFQAFDDELVQVLFVLLVPTEEVDEHLQVLAMLAKRFEANEYRDSLVSATQDEELYQSAIVDLTPEVK